MILTSHGNLIEVNKLDEYHIKGLLLSTETNSHLEFFDPWYYYGRSKIFRHLSKYKYIIHFYIPFKIPLNYKVDSVLFLRSTTKTYFSVRYARNIFNVFYFGTKAY